MADKPQYFNFPIQLLEGMLINSKSCLVDIMYCSLYEHAEDKMEYGDEDDRFQSAVEFFNIELGDFERAKIRGHELYCSVEPNSPKVGLNLSIFWDYYKNEKTEFEIVCLLAFLAIKSIVQNKAYCKMTSLFMLSRMDGIPYSVKDEKELCSSIRKYANEYQLKKIKLELIHGWGLVHYSRYMRGFYVSFKLDLKELVYQAEKRRKSTKLKALKAKEKDAIEEALKRLQNEG